METLHYTSIFDFIIRQESAYAKTITLPTGKTWSLKDHINRSALYRDSDIVGPKDDFTPIKNITRPILNLQYRTEDIDVKDVQLYVNDKDKYHLSFLVKKYHDDVFVVENDLDSYLDEVNQSRVDFGAGLSKQLNKPCPESVPLQSIAFCDQRDILSRPIGLKHSYAPDELLDMGSKGWGSTKNGATATLQETILLSRNNQKDNVSEGDIEIYEIHGNMPKRFADVNNDSGEYESRLFICCFYQKKTGDGKEGIILYTAPETVSPFKLIKRDPIYGRAVGFGGAEELFEPQVWVNYDMIREQDLLDASSKTILKASGPNGAAIANKNSVRDMDNLQIIDVADGDLAQVDTFPRNMRLFDQSIAQWEMHAKEIGAAQDPIQGKEPASGTPFSSLAEQIRQGLGLHDYRRGIYAKHIEEVYKDWIIPHIEKKICEGMTFLSELSLDDLQYVSDCLLRNATNTMLKDMILNGQIPSQQIVDTFKQKFLAELKRKGNKFFIEILKNEFKSVPLAVKVNVAGKQKNLAGMVDKLTNVFKTIIGNPYILQSPPIATLFNKIIEASGLDPIDLSNFNVPPLPTRRMTETIDYADLQPDDQKAMLKLAGIDTAPAAPMTPH